MGDGRDLDRLNRLLQLFSRGLPRNEGAVLPYRTFGIDRESAIALVGQNVRLFETAVDEWLDLIPGAKGTLSRKKLLDELIPLVRTKVNNGENFTEDESDQLKRTISDSPLRQFRVLRRIYGVALRSGSAPVQMGDFLVHHGGWVPDQIREHPFFSAMQGREDAEESFIECRVQARDSDKAGDLADVLFYRFELLMRLLIGRRTRSFEVGILNYVGPQLRRSREFTRPCFPKLTQAF
jgi:hypothetical protein